MPWLQSARARLRRLDAVDLTLALVLLLPPLVNFQSSRNFNVKVAVLELVFVLVVALRLPRTAFRLAAIERRTLILFVAFALWMFFTVPFAEHQRYAFNRNFSVLLHFLFGYAVWCYLGARAQRHAWAASLVSLSFLAPALGLLLFALVAGSVSPEQWAHPPYYSNIRHLGYHVLAATIFAFWMLLRGAGPVLTAAAGGWLAICIGYLLWSGSRGSILGLLFAALALLVMVRRIRRRVLVTLAVCTAVPVGVILLFNAEAFMQFMIRRTMAADSIAGLLGTRLIVWQESLASVQNWLLGIGGDNFIRLDVAARLRLSQAHNVVVQALLDWGIPGALAFLTLLTVVMYRALAALRSVGREDSLVVAGAGLLLAYLAVSVIDGVFYHGVPFMLFVVAGALVFSHPARGVPHSG